jgi:hypothetical protein
MFGWTIPKDQSLQMEVLAEKSSASLAEDTRDFRFSLSDTGLPNTNVLALLGDLGRGGWTSDESSSFKPSNTTLRIYKAVDNDDFEFLQVQTVCTDPRLYIGGIPDHC